MTITPPVIQATIEEDLQRLSDGDLPESPETISEIAGRALSKINHAERRLREQGQQVADMARRKTQANNSQRAGVLEWAEEYGIDTEPLRALLVDRLGLQGPPVQWTVTVKVNCRVESSTIFDQVGVHRIDGEVEADDDFLFTVTRKIVVEAADEDEAAEEACQTVEDEVGSELGYGAEVEDSDATDVEEGDNL